MIPSLLGPCQPPADLAAEFAAFAPGPPSLYPVQAMLAPAPATQLKAAQLVLSCERAIATGATPYLWIGGHEYPGWTQADVARLAVELDQRMRRLDGTPVFFIARVLLEPNVNLATYKDPATYRALYAATVQTMRAHGLGEDRMLTTCCLWPNAQLLDPGAWITDEANAVGMDQYQAQQLDWSSKHGKGTLRTIDAARQRGKPLFMLESGLACPGVVENPGASIAQFNALLQVRAIAPVFGWCINARDWLLDKEKQAGPYAALWRDSQITHSPVVLAHVKAALAQADVVLGPFQHSTRGEAAVALAALVAAAA